jgi:Niemann-Pick C2 protein
MIVYSFYNKFSSVAEKNIKSLNTKVKATVLGLTVDYPLPEPDACKSLIDSACPLEAGDLATYKLELPITPVIPTVSNH